MATSSHLFPPLPMDSSHTYTFLLIQSSIWPTGIMLPWKFRLWLLNLSQMSMGFLALLAQHNRGTHPGGQEQRLQPERPYSELLGPNAPISLVCTPAEAEQTRLMFP